MARARQVLFRIATPVLICLAVEGSLRVFDAQARIGIAERRTLAAYQGVPWIDQYLKDLYDCERQTARAHEPRYARYVLQDINEDCTTPTVNYAHRVRRTWNPDASTRPGATVYEVGMFGGSTMEGQGAIDDETIPSQFSKLANAGGGPVVYHVTNYGVGGYTFTQSVYKLLELLREGRHFDLVIFYDGANDIDYAYDFGEAGALAEEDLVRTRLEGSPWAKMTQFGKEQLNACVLCFAVSVVARHTPFLEDRLTPWLVRVRDAIHFKKGKGEDTDEEPLAEEIAANYAQSHALLERIAAAYQLLYLDAWQPSLMYDSQYAPGEAMLAKMDPRLTDQKLRNLYALSHTDIVAKHLNGFDDLSQALAGRTRACYLDAVHLCGACNGVVASKLHALFAAGEIPRAASARPPAAPGS
ncbi:MAG TPA: SGNH/GDSL hydrolase family protein [Vicinamibacterales bacterium]|nr:SGNH/GDSL hydrolase family protein [Vicinamibacterales bacterium]